MKQILWTVAAVVASVALAGVVYLSQRSGPATVGVEPVNASAEKQPIAESQIAQDEPFSVSSSSPVSHPLGSFKLSLKLETWPRYDRELSGSRSEIRVSNPNTYPVKVGLRSDGKGLDFILAAEKFESIDVPNGEYRIYFQHLHEPGGIFQADSFSLTEGAVEIQIPKMLWH